MCKKELDPKETFKFPKFPDDDMMYVIQKIK